jgi:hypothetical protein
MRKVRDSEVHQAERDWAAGGSALPAVRGHLKRGDKMTAAVIARAALGRTPCPDAEEIERLLLTIDEMPPEWDEQLRTFAANPSLERWRELLTFVPEDLLYHRVRNSIHRLRALGLGGDWLFLCACEMGITPDAIQLVEEGAVAMATIEQRAATAGGAKTAYLGLAATAAFLAGDLIATIRLLRESAALANEWSIPDPHIHFIREHASAEFLEALDRAGIPEAFA